MTPEPTQAPAVSAVTGTTTASRAPWSAPVPAGSPRAGYLPTEPPPGTRPAAPSSWERRAAPAAPASQPPAQEPAAAAPSAPDDD
ncbi:MAG TPA: DNA polymerase III subunit gamma/tau, partial [Streptosporangiaceae bacterium]|nr:DNA polymerase III subunit gamma/tau [Streptosporangiaceae bacterium]